MYNIDKCITCFNGVDAEFRNSSIPKVTSKDKDDFEELDSMFCDQLAEPLNSRLSMTEK